MDRFILGLVAEYVVTNVPYHAIGQRSQNSKLGLDLRFLKARKGRRRQIKVNLRSIHRRTSCAFKNHVWHSCRVGVFFFIFLGQ